MIGNAIIGILYILESFMIQKLPPSSGFPQGVTDAFNDVSTYIKLVDHFIPLSDLVVVVLAIMTLELIIFGLHSTRFFINVTRGSRA